MFLKGFLYYYLTYILITCQVDIIFLFLNHYMSVLLNRIIKYLKAKGIDAKKVKKKKKSLCFLVIICQKSIGVLEISVYEKQAGC